ncbi:unnamed protein product [Fraxinus pennsylvanica]|uniref:Uncharacterized protein n=1 Tax=Fraxinus pennsylvanica TaxID=56036 RepID=A0AAD2ECL3_9LAMI|nr:unnamed protein product [Fraxinus pennsylvanica]
MFMEKATAEKKKAIAKEEKVIAKEEKQIAKKEKIIVKLKAFKRGKQLELKKSKIYDIGKDFQLNWSSKNGGSLCIFHKSQPSISMWSTVPGRSFVSAAESGGSFVIKDRDIHLICNHQTIDNIRTIDPSYIVLHATNQDFTSFSIVMDQESQQKGIQLPALLITGKIFCVKKRKHSIQNSELIEKQPSTYARYWMLFDQKNNNQIGFQLRLAKPKVEYRQKLSPRTYSYRASASKFG